MNYIYVIVSSSANAKHIDKDPTITTSLIERLEKSLSVKIR